MKSKIKNTMDRRSCFNRRGFEFSFAWTFAVIVGSAILFLAVYAAAKLVETERKVQDTEAAKELGIILNPIETSLESAKLSKIAFSVETRIFNNCRAEGNFGAQEIKIATKSGIGEEWQETAVPSTFYNKYIFSDRLMEGKELLAFSKPLSMPFEIANVIYLIEKEDNYCLVSPPSEIEEELKDLGIINVNISSDLKKCGKESRKVCFTGSGCDIDVRLDIKSVKKENKVVFYEDDAENALLYAAIFSDSGVYECQAKRLMKRASELALLYRAKGESLSARGCRSGLESDLKAYANSSAGIKESRELSKVKLIGDELKKRNDALNCKLF